MLPRNDSLFQTARATPPSSPMPSNVFLLDPFNKSFLSGRRGSFIVLDFDFFLTVGMALSLFLLLLILVRGSINLNLAYQLMNAPTTAQGKIVGHRQAGQGSMNQGQLYYVSYEFSLSEGSDVYRREQFVTRETYKVLTDGSSVTVRYLPSAPDNSTLVYEMQDQRLGATDFVLMVIGLIGSVVVALYLLPMLKSLWQQIDLRRNGQVVIGHISSCRRFVLSTPTSLHPDDYGAALSSQFFVELAYRFHDPLHPHKELRGWAKHKRDDLAGTHLPIFGTPVAVLYLDEQHYDVL